MTGFLSDDNNGYNRYGCRYPGRVPGPDYAMANDGRKLMKQIPYVRNGKLYAPTGGVILSLPGPAERTGWVAWLENHKSFRYESASGATCAVVKQKRTGASGNTHWYWYANKHIFGKLKRRYLGRSEDVTISALEQAAGELVQLEAGERDKRRVLEGD